MALFDFPIDKLKTYNPEEKAPKGFDAFWKSTLAETTKAGGGSAEFTRVNDSFYKTVDVYDVTLKGFMGQPVKGWFVEPAGNKEKLPVFVSFIGYGGGRGLPVDHLLAAASGFSNLVMDTRGQGSNWSPGDTNDDAPTGPHFPGFMTRGIQSPETYYYRRVYTDAAMAVLAAIDHPRVDPAKVAVTGGSQGGGISLAAAGLLGKKVKLCMADVPFLCNFKRATTIVDSHPYFEIASFLKAHRDLVEQSYETLAYFDNIHFAPKISAKTLVSVALMDNICPPSTVFAAYNRIKAKKEIAVYQFNNHEGGGAFQATNKLRFATEHF